MTPPDEELDHLLARGRLRGPSSDRILDRVLAETAPKRRSWIAFAAPVSLVLAGAAATFVLAPRLREPGDAADRPQSGDRDGLRAKGTGGAATAGLSCLGGSEGVCPLGAVLAFTVEVPRGSRLYLAAYAEPQ